MLIGDCADIKRNMIIERENIQWKEREATRVLSEFQKGKNTMDKTRRLMFTLMGITKTAACRLDRLPKECSIFLHTSAHSCEGCGHHC